ncbi:MAG: type II toxin-antitoxin system Phd/YefM family antitoxin [Chthoniobacterales bacterium]|jgi:prevent-host-death family protein
MDSVLISEFKAKCIQLLKTVNETGRPLLVTLRGKPLARVEPVRTASKNQIQLGGMRDTLEIKTDIVHTDTTSDWEIER